MKAFEPIKQPLSKLFQLKEIFPSQISTKVLYHQKYFQRFKNLKIQHF